MTTPNQPSRRQILAGGAALAAAFAGRASAQQAPEPPSPGQRGATLLARTAQLEGLRTAKRVQHALGHYTMSGMWAEAANLFARDALLRDRTGRAVAGRRAIEAHLRATQGNGADGIAPGRLNIAMAMSPVLNVTADGARAMGRWRELSMLGEYGAYADWAGGIHENEYVLEDGEWKIAFLNYHGRFQGPYEGGWRNTANGGEIAPFHYNPRGAGVPLAPPPADLTPLEAGGLPRIAADIAARAQALIDESLIQNLQNAYGFYVDRKMWDDVADLFAEDGAMEIGNEGAYLGKASIRRGLNRYGATLGRAQLNDHAQLQMVVTLNATGLAARARGIELGMTGVNGARGAWSVGVFENAYVKQDGAWRIASMRVTPVMKADYALGWAKDAQAPARPSRRFRPDRAPAATLTAYPGAVIVPDFSFTAPGANLRAAGGSGARLPDMAEAERLLAVAAAYDGAENVCNAYGYYIDEFQWDDTANLFSENGWKELSYVGTYIGRDRVRDSMKLRYGVGGRASPGMTLHQKIQPVISVTADGQSARVRERLFQMNSSPAAAGSYIGGVYEDECVLEAGVWKIAGMDLDYVWLGDYAGGWTRVDAERNARFAPAPDFLEQLPPDRPLRGVIFAPFPEIAPMGFHYVNPVSGRAPAVLLPPGPA